MDEIKIFDDFFDKDLHHEIHDRIYSGSWGISGNIPEKPEIFWHNDDLENDSYFTEYLFTIIQRKLGQEYTLERVYANGQTAMQCGTPHTDDGDLTFLYYANKEWMPNWQGHLIFMEKELNKPPEGNPFGCHSEMETSRMVSYKPNRAVLFPGHIWHYADAPSRFFNGLRISLAYKLWN